MAAESTVQQRALCSGAALVCQPARHGHYTAALCSWGVATEGDLLKSVSDCKPVPAAVHPAMYHILPNYLYNARLPLQLQFEAQSIAYYSHFTATSLFILEYYIALFTLHCLQFILLT